MTGARRRQRPASDSTGGFDPTSFVSAAALVKEPEESIDWIIDDLLPAGGLSLVLGKPKSGKSTLVRQFAHAVARGDCCLGRRTTRGGALYVTVEERRTDVRAHFAHLGTKGTRKLRIHVGRMVGVPSDAPAYYGHHAETIREQRLAWLTAAIMHFEPLLVIIDPLARFLAMKDLNDYAEVTEATAPVIALARERGAHLCFTHHAKKKEASAIDAALGSTAIAGMVDTIALVRRSGDSVRTLESTQRIGNDLSPAVLVYDPQTGRLSLGGTREEARRALILQRILAYLATVPSATRKAILQAVRGDTALKKAALRDGVERGLIRCRGVGTPRHPYCYSLRKKRRKGYRKTTSHSSSPDQPDPSDLSDQSDQTDPRESQRSGLWSVGPKGAQDGEPSNEQAEGQNAAEGTTSVMAKDRDVLPTVEALEAAIEVARLHANQGGLTASDASTSPTECIETGPEVSVGVTPVGSIPDA
jgi:hypothetical protein